MKKLLGFVILSGFVLMLGAAGGADASHISFASLLLLEFVGMIIVLFGTSALMHYKRYVRRMMRKRAAGRVASGKKVRVAAKVHFNEKELC